MQARNLIFGGLGLVALALGFFSIQTASARQVGSAGEKWEYKAVTLTPPKPTDFKAGFTGADVLPTMEKINADKFNELGNQGWELAAAENGIYWFKRPKQ